MKNGSGSTPDKKTAATLDPGEKSMIHGLI
jgi:hypothetical protein